MIKGIMSESLHIRGIMSKEFSAIRCLDFNGSTDYVEVNHDASLNFGTGNFAIGFWIKKTSTAQETIIFKSNGIWGAGNDGFDIFSAGTVIYVICGDGTKYIRDTFLVGYSDDNWHCVMALFDKTKTRTGLYFDNSKINVYVHYGNDLNEIGNTNSASNLKIGKGKIGFYWNGKTAKPGIWNRIPTLEEIINYHNGKAPRNGLVAEWLMREQQGNKIYDTSVNSNHGTIYGADWYEEKFNTPLKGIMSNSSEITGTMTAEYT